MKRMQQRRKKRRPAFLKVWERQGSLFDPLYLIASEFESPQLEKLVFCIFFVRLSPEASNYLEIAFLQLFRLKSSHKTRKHCTFVQCFPVLHLLATQPGADGRIRTGDLLITNQLLYQLSYTSVALSSAGNMIP